VFKAIFTLSLLLFSATVHADCAAQSSIKPSAMIGAVASQCQSLSTKAQKKRYLSRTLTRIKRIRGVLAQPTWKSVRTGIKTLRKTSCSTVPAFVAGCSSTLVTTTEHVVGELEDGACSKTYATERQTALKKILRKLNRLEPLIGSPSVTAIEKEISGLLTSKSCGEGGSDLLNHCRAIYETADGIGKNVYKLLHYAPYLPLFVTRDDSKNCIARRKSGKVIEPLGYSGLANPDDAGLRHHYRFSKTCDQLPELFYIECSGRCYEIDDRCGRID
jgi:hypothetical protein